MAASRWHRIIGYQIVGAAHGREHKSALQVLFWFQSNETKFEIQNNMN